MEHSYIAECPLKTVVFPELHGRCALVYRSGCGVASLPAEGCTLALTRLVDT